MKEDADLLNAFVTNRDEASFRELVDRRIGFVYAVNLRRLRDSHLAKDATQAVFIALARKAGSVARSPSVMGWLHRCSCYESLNLMRAQTNRIARETEAERLGTTTGGPLSSRDHGALESVLDEILDQLPATDREIIIAHYFHQRTYVEIGGNTGRSENAIRMRADRALTKLRDRLESRSLSSAAAVLAGILPSYATAAVPSGLAVTVANTALTTLGTGALSASLLLSMSTTKIVTTAAVFAAVAFVGFEAYQNKNLRDELSDLRQQNAQTTENFRRLENQLLSLTPKATTTAVPTSATSPAKVAASRPTEKIDQAAVAGITRTPPAGWRKNGSNPTLFDVGVDPSRAFGGVPSAYAKSASDSAENNFGGMMQSTSAEQYKNQRVRMTGWIKTEDANDRGAHLWLRVDGQTAGNLLGFDNMDNRAPKGTTDWQEYSIVLDVPNDATSLNYGFFLGGKGQMWVNGVNIERVGPEYSTTNMLKPIKPPPAGPVNLGFNPSPATGG